MAVSLWDPQRAITMLQVDLQPRVGAVGAGLSREDVIAGVARDIASKIPEPFDLQLLHKSIDTPSPTQVVLLQEIEHWNKVRLGSMPCPIIPSQDHDTRPAGQITEPPCKIVAAFGNGPCSMHAPSRFIVACSGSK